MGQNTRALRAFWDTSAVVPLCCQDKFSIEARTLSRRFERIIVWWNTRVEIRSALTRLLRDGKINKEGFRNAMLSVEALQARWSEVLPIEAVREIAEDCLDRFPLRSPDALQLAAALLWCNSKPKRRAFICFDPQLSNAAMESGFDVHP